MRVRGGDLVVRALEREGVRFTLGIPGTHTIELYDALERSRTIEPVLVTSELAGSFMADGISRTSDQIGVLTVVPGAGVTHALSGIAEAFLDNVPLVVIACGIRADTGAAYQLHDIDQAAVLRPVTKAVLAVERADQIEAVVAQAFRIARAGCPGPTAVVIPANLMMLTAEAPQPPPAQPSPQPLSPEEGLVVEAARRLRAARHPALYLGWGAAAAADLLPALAERLGAPVTTTFQGKGVFPERHPLWLWPGFGAQAPPFVRRVMERCDALLAIGCRFGEVATGSYGIRPPAELIHVDVDASVFDRNYKTSMKIASDARVFVEALLAVLDGPRGALELREEIAAGHADLARRAARRHPRRGVAGAALFAALQSAVADDAVFATDSGNGTFLAAEHLRLEGPGRFIAPVDYSCMGYAVPAAIGAALANPGRDVVALPGDGALLMTGLELLTASSRRLPLMVCVLRDRKLGQIAQFQRIPLNRETCSVLPEYQVENVARATGCRFFRVAVAADLASVLPLAVATARGGETTVVEVVVDESERTFFTRGVVATNFRRLAGGERVRILSRALRRRIVS